MDGQPSLHVPTRELCKVIINEDSLKKLGRTAPYCYIDKNN